MKKIGTASLAITILLASSAFFSAIAIVQDTQAQANILFVAPSPTGTGTSGGSCAAPGFNTIGSAITFAAGAPTIFICPGTYHEQLVITKSLKLFGLDTSSVPIIAAPTTTLAIDPLCVAYPSAGCVGGDPITDIISISNHASVTISNLIVSGPGPSSCASIMFGIFVYGSATAVIRNTVITKIEDNPFGGCQSGVALQAGWSTASYAPIQEVGTARLVSVTINNYQKNGITVDGTGSMLTMLNSLVTGAGPQATNGQNGVQISDDANANIRGSTISGDQWTATATQNPGYPSGSNIETELQSPCILFYAGGSATIINNNILTGCDAGIDAYLTNSGSGMSIASNLFLSPTYYGAILEDSNMTLSHNRFTGGLYGVAVVSDPYGVTNGTLGRLVQNTFSAQSAGSVFTWALPNHQVVVTIK